MIWVRIASTFPSRSLINDRHQLTCMFAPSRDRHSTDHNKWNFLWEMIRSATNSFEVLHFKFIRISNFSWRKKWMKNFSALANSVDLVWQKFVWWKCLYWWMKKNQIASILFQFFTASLDLGRFHHTEYRRHVDLSCTPALVGQLRPQWNSGEHRMLLLERFSLWIFLRYCKSLDRISHREILSCRAPMHHLCKIWLVFL